MPATIKNLIPLNKRTKEEQRRIQSMGGRTKTPKRKLAAQIRELKKKGLSNDAAKRITDILEHPDVTALDIYLFISEARKAAKTTKDIVAVGNLLVNWAKWHHGDKKTAPDIAIQVNNSITIISDDELKKTAERLMN